jgi:hypothetical protein
MGLSLFANQTLLCHAPFWLEFMLVNILSFLPCFTIFLLLTANKKEKKCERGFSDSPHVIEKKPKKKKSKKLEKNL